MNSKKTIYFFVYYVNVIFILILFINNGTFGFCDYTCV